MHVTLETPEFQLTIGLPQTQWWHSAKENMLPYISPWQAGWSGG